MRGEEVRSVEWLTCVNPDGTVAGDGYRIERPMPGSGGFRRTIIWQDERQSAPS